MYTPAGGRPGHPQGVPLRLDEGCTHRREGDQGTHKGCPYGWMGDVHTGGWATRAPTRGAPTVGWGMYTPGGGRPGHPQGVPLRLDGGCTHRGVGDQGTHKGCPYGWMGDVHTGGWATRAPTRGAPTVGWGVYTPGGGRPGHPQGVPLRLDGGCTHHGEGDQGTHKGCPYGWMGDVHTGGRATRAPTRGAPTVGWGMYTPAGGRPGHPQGVPLRLDGGCTHRREGDQGTHKGCPYGWMRDVHTGGRATRAPTRGAPTVG